jgi:hypothetical protein
MKRLGYGPVQARSAPGQFEEGGAVCIAPAALPTKQATAVTAVAAMITRRFFISLPPYLVIPMTSPSLEPTNDDDVKVL